MMCVYLSALPGVSDDARTCSILNSARLQTQHAFKLDGDSQRSGHHGDGAGVESRPGDVPAFASEHFQQHLAEFFHAHASVHDYPQVTVPGGIPCLEDPVDGSPSGPCIQGRSGKALRAHGSSTLVLVLAAHRPEQMHRVRCATLL